ncbi:MAG: hypothetical protein JNL87_21800 [Burkholderiaceae bacterium]|nr:hypothetical protein [Burkholderiaceae bacterium]
MRKALIALALAQAAQFPAFAADASSGPPDDLEALKLADESTGDAPQQAQPWRVFVEAAAGRGRLRGGDSRFGLVRGALDARADVMLTNGLRAVFSDRLDLVDSDGVPPGKNINTLREAYLSWARSDDQIFDLGRVNLRNGAAMGYNPTDWFKEDALRAIVNPDPAVIRENRQGTVVVQAQQLWVRASLTAAFSPRLARSGDEATFALNAGATNPSNRWLLAGSYKFADKFNPQWLIHGGADTSTQVGLNISTLIGDATVAFGEFSAGKGTSLISQALAVAEAPSYQQRAAAGLTYTTAFKLSLTAEFEYSSAAPVGDDWNALSAPARQQVLAKSQALQELPSRTQWFIFATWDDLFVQRLSASGFVRRDLETRSSAMWLEARYRWERTDLALQWQLLSGPPGSVYHAAPQQKTGQVVLRVYF